MFYHFVIWLILNFKFKPLSLWKSRAGQAGFRVQRFSFFLKPIKNIEYNNGLFYVKTRQSLRIIIYLLDFLARSAKFTQL